MLVRGGLVGPGDGEKASGRRGSVRPTKKEHLRKASFYLKYISVYKYIFIYLESPARFCRVRLSFILKL